MAIHLQKDGKPVGSLMIQKEWSDWCVQWMERLGHFSYVYAGVPSPRSLTPNGVLGWGTHLHPWRQHQLSWPFLFTYSPLYYSIRRNGEYWWIHNVYVIPEERRSGVFRFLYQHVVELGKASDAVGVKLYTHNSNERAQRAYRTLGMENHEMVFDFVWRKH